MRQLEKRNLKIAKSKSSILFDKDTPPGEKIKISSKDKCYCIFAAPGNQMLVHEQNPSTELTIKVFRSEIKKEKELFLDILIKLDHIKVAKLMKSQRAHLII